MAKLINGDGNTAVYASEDADLIASLAGNVTGIAKLGNQFAYELADANTIEVKDGVIITQEGRRVQLDVNAVDIFEIPNGVQGDTNYYIIGYKLETDAESKQTATTFVQLMDNGTDTIPEGTFRGGDTDVYISLYRVTQDGLSITDVDLLLPVLDNISELKSALTWKHLDEKAGGTGINLPSSFKEILMIVKYGNHRYSINVPNAEILATDTFYRGGFYFSNSNMDVYTVSVNSNSVTLTQMIASNSDVLSTASLNVYYK